jgi:homoserine kinase
MNAPTPTGERFLARAPGGIGNLGPGLDVLGCAVAGLYDEVIAEWSAQPDITLLDAGHPDLPRSPSEHTAAIAASAVLVQAREMGVTLRMPGIALRAKKGLPLAGGQGGSAASAVAGAVAANALIGGPLDSQALLACCLEAEARVAGRHLDNIAPVLLGGIVLVRSLDPIEVIRLPVPTDLHIVLVHPAQRLATAESRRVLPGTIPRSIVTHQLAMVAAMVAACYANDLALLGRSLDDRLAEPARAALLPGFADAKRAALEAGALGASISGAGPTTFAIVGDVIGAERVAAAMHAAYARHGVACTTRVTEVDSHGTTVRAI